MKIYSNKPKSTTQGEDDSLSENQSLQEGEDNRSKRQVTVKGAEITLRSGTSVKLYKGTLVGILEPESGSTSNMILKDCTMDVSETITVET